MWSHVMLHPFTGTVVSDPLDWEILVIAGTTGGIQGLLALPDLLTRARFLPRHGRLMIAGIHLVASAVVVILAGPQHITLSIGLMAIVVPLA